MDVWRNFANIEYRNRLHMQPFKFYVIQFIGEPSLNNLAKGSTSWGSMRKSNLAEFLSDTEDDDVVTASSQRKNSDRLSAKKNSSTKQTGKSRESDTRRKGLYTGFYELR